MLVCLVMARSPIHDEGRFQRAVGRAVRAQRAIWGISQGSLAEEVGMPRAALAKVEAGIRRATITEVAAFCAVFGVDLHGLFQPVWVALDDETQAAVERVTKRLAGG